MKSPITKSPTAVLSKFKDFRITLLIFCISAVLYSCEKDTASINSEIESRLIQQLKAANANCTCDPSLDIFVWNTETVYVLSYKGPACNSIPSFYNSNGETWALPQGVTTFSFFGQSTFIKNIWTCTP